MQNTLLIFFYGCKITVSKQQKKNKRKKHMCKFVKQFAPVAVSNYYNLFALIACKAICKR